MNILYGYIAAFLVGASGAWYVQGIRWDNDVASISLASANATVAAVEAINAEMTKARAETETIRTTFLEYKAGKEDETSDLERAIADGAKRLRIKASCPESVRADGSVPGRAGSGQPELDATARLDYYALRRGIDRQYGLLQFCRSELRKRSAK